IIELILQKVDILKLESKIFRAFKSNQPQSSFGVNSSNFYPQPDTLIKVLVHDQLFSSRGISLAKVHKIRQAIERHAIALRAELSRLMAHHGVSQASQLLIGASTSKAMCPNQVQSSEAEAMSNTMAVRWMRINLNKWSCKEAIRWLGDTGWTQVDLKILLTAPTLTKQIFAMDDHISCLIAFPPTIALATLEPYLDGRLIAQDKASCIPAQLLLGDVGFDEGVQVIDATAAPGNKTTMLSAMVGKNGKVWAFERDPERFVTLQEMVSKAGCTNVECVLGDFLSIKHSDQRFKNVSYIMVDPSCSGSGISNRLDHLTASNSRDDRRILALSRFQTTIVSHALRFPSVIQVAYSTCSIWREENEEVVFRILKKPEMIERGWVLKDVQLTFAEGKSWNRTGQAKSEEEKLLTDQMIRFDPELDHTIGFFAAVFKRNSAALFTKLEICSTKGPQLMTTNPSTTGRLKYFEATLTEKQQCWKGIKPGKLLYLP
ncbi:hypothetical protein O181_004891, partial [Austropuccinia psidii MF-1]|nr:hypothetical protein [Austropuccinia psidii MF-1]